LKAVNTLFDCNSDEILAALKSDARKHWELGANYFSKE
jgi:hypothetical protein